MVPQTCRPAKFVTTLIRTTDLSRTQPEVDSTAHSFPKNSVSVIPNQETSFMSTKVSAITCFRVGKLPVNWLSLTVIVTGHIDLKPYGRDLRAPKSQSQIATIFCRKRPRRQQKMDTPFPEKIAIASDFPSQGFLGGGEGGQKFSPASENLGAPSPRSSMKF